MLRFTLPLGLLLLLFSITDLRAGLLRPDNDCTLARRDAALSSAVNMPLPADPWIDLELNDMLADERQKLPVPGELLYDCTNMLLYGFTKSNGATKSILEAEDDLPFSKKMLINVKVAGENSWEPQLQTPKNQIPVDKGDVLLYIFYIRTIDTESPNDFGKAGLFCQLATSPWTTIGDLSLNINTSWRKYYLIAEAGISYDTTEMLATFHLGFLQQKLEIGGIIALNLGSEVNIEDLPRNTVNYEGMEENASWRAEAEARIEQHRKSDIAIQITDSTGNPVSGAQVSIKMKDHAFGFGTFISDMVLQSTADAMKYRNHILELFNCATTPFYMGGNADNWGWYGSGTAKSVYPNMAHWLDLAGIPAKGHVLVWPGWDYMPSFFEDLKSTPSELSSAIDEHLETLVPIGKENGLYEWDVVNEPFINHDVMDVLGEHVLVDWYEKVHELDSIPKLIFNEYNILMGGGRPDFQENFERLITYLQDEGAPLGGIGMQGHFDELLTGIPDILSILDRFSVFGLPIQITEFDVSIRDEEVQAKYLRDFYTAVYSHPATEKIVMWGFYEKVMWKPLAALVREDWTTKENYDVYMDLLYNKWWTKDTLGSTDSSGMFNMRGFNGKYDILIETEDTSYSYTDYMLLQDSTIKIGSEKADTTLNIIRKSSMSDFRVKTYPNPFSESIIISCENVREAEIDVRLYNGIGSEVRSMSRNLELPGKHELELDGKGLNPGIYFCVINNYTSSQKVKRTLIKN